MLLLGEEVERHNRIRTSKLEEVSACVAELRTGRAREHGAGRIEVIVTAPGRQSENAEELVHRLALAAGAPTRVVSAEEEGRLAYLGAVAGAEEELPETVAVCDVGGGSTELVVGTLGAGPAWSRSVDLGCVRLTERFLPEDPPGKEALARAAEEAERHFDGIVPPLPQAALAAGGTARALRKVVGPSLGADELRGAARRIGEALLPGAVQGSWDRPQPGAHARGRSRPPGCRATPPLGAARGRPDRAPRRLGSGAPRRAAGRVGAARRGRGMPRPALAGGGITSPRRRSPSSSSSTRAPPFFRPSSAPSSSSTTSPCVQSAGVDPLSSSMSPWTSPADRPSANSSRSSTARPSESASGTERLDAADVRARDESVHAEIGERADETGGLAPPAVVKRAEPVVACPSLPLARPRMPDEKDLHDQAALPAFSSRRQAFANSARAAARRARSRSIRRPAARTEEPERLETMARIRSSATTAS